MQRTSPSIPFTVSKAGLLPKPLRPATPHMEEWQDLLGNTHAYSYAVGTAHCLQFPGVGVYVFEQHERKVTAFPESGVEDITVRSTYLRDVLPVVLQATGVEVVHGSAVCTTTGVVAFCANSGTGKSTIAYALNGRGYAIWADDIVAFDVLGNQPPAVSAVSLPFRSRLRAASMDYFGLIEEDTNVSATEVQESVPVVAFCLLNRCPLPILSDSTAPIVISRCPATKAFSALLAQTLALRPDDVARRRHMVRSYLQVAEHVPVFSVDFVPGFEVFPAVLDGIQREVLQPLSK